jgi:hypothetical protein
MGFESHQRILGNRNDVKPFGVLMTFHWLEDQPELLVCESDLPMYARPATISDRRNAITPPRRLSSPAVISRSIERHQGSLAASISRSVSATEIAAPLHFFGTGGSLLVTGFVFSKPHRMAWVNALDRTPAMFRTVFFESARGASRSDGVRHLRADGSIRAV